MPARGFHTPPSSGYAQGVRTAGGDAEDPTMKTFLLGVAVGYVLGARAGRERYDELVRAYRRLKDHPAVQGVAGVVRAKLGGQDA
jgi:hypothetical protein